MKKLAILDTFAILHRAWHAIPNLTTKDGMMVNAVYGFTSILLKIIKELKPDYLVAATDLPGGTFRHKAFPQYKAQREAPEEDFLSQIDLTEQMLRALNIPILGTSGYEADDIIGSVCRDLNTHRKDMKVTIVSGDLDTLQLINEKTEVFTMRRNIGDTLIYDTAAVKDRYGLTPHQLIDMKALMGDPSDNIPGVKGIGEKGARDLIKTFGSLEHLYKNLDSKKIKPRIRELLRDQKEQALLSKRLVTIVTNLQVKLDLEKASVSNYDLKAASDIFKKLEFKSLFERLPQNEREAKKIGRLASKKTYQTCNAPDEIQQLARKFTHIKTLCVDTETTGLGLDADILGASFSWKEKEAVFVHLRDKKNRDAFRKHMGPILENKAIKKIGHNLKFDYQVFRRLGITVQGLHFDTLLAAYLLHPERSLKLEDLVFAYLKIKMQSLHDIAEEAHAVHKTRKRDIDMWAIPPESLAQYGASDADATFRLYRVLEQALKKVTCLKLLYDIEMPLVPILADMEMTGVLIDTTYLHKVEQKLKRDIHTIEYKIFTVAGQTFNIASPLQLKEILFQKLNIDTSGISRKKTGLSTAASELEKLHDRHPIIPLIIEYRELSKLLNTYVETLPSMIDPRDGRVHTSFNQTVTATGRLSSSNPNLQNIPVRTKLGRMIRRAFVAPHGSLLVSADYSQIELRLAAVISKDPGMLASFQKGEDIHKRTAAEVFGVPLSKVTPSQRRHAKEVNFGVIYGLGYVGLAQRTGMSRPEAKQFIETYFTIHKKIKEYIKRTKQRAHKQGYVETLFGRRRYLPEIKSSLPQLVAQAERMAVNMPLQGTAADLMKLAMIRVARHLPKKFPSATMILQVHDELVFEIIEPDVKKFTRFIKGAMESVASYPIPLLADVTTGTNWADVT